MPLFFTLNNYILWNWDYKREPEMVLEKDDERRGYMEAYMRITAHL